MRIWVVCRDGRPWAAFSTAGSANDFIAESGGAERFDAKCLILDACTGAQHRWEFRFSANQVAGKQQ